VVREPDQESLPAVVLYNLSCHLAKRAETAFGFERPENSAIKYIHMGYWTNAGDGLLTGKQLFLVLKRLAVAATA
jgi:hypothetical protein